MKRVPDGLRPDKPAFFGELEMPDALWSTMLACWDAIPANRLSAEEASRIMISLVRST